MQSGDSDHVYRPPLATVTVIPDMLQGVSQEIDYRWRCLPHDWR
jgi:hypothetical protein